MDCSLYSKSSGKEINKSNFSNQQNLKTTVSFHFLLGKIPLSPDLLKKYLPFDRITWKFKMLFFGTAKPPMRERERERERERTEPAADLSASAWFVTFVKSTQY